MLQGLNLFLWVLSPTMSGRYSSGSPMEQDYLVGEVGLNKLETLLASA
jgi:hypothetical protein